MPDMIELREAIAVINDMIEVEKGFQYRNERFAEYNRGVNSELCERYYTQSQHHLDKICGLWQLIDKLESLNRS